MNRKAILSSLLLVALAACNLFTTTPITGPQDTPTTDPQVQIAQAVLQTFEAQTQIAGAVQATMAAMTTDTPEVPSQTPSPTFTPTPQAPQISVSLQTNCRSGPGTVYAALGIMNVGETADVVGRSVYNDNWIIRLPSNPAIICWLWGHYATVVGDTSTLPVVNPPPTPTPVPAFDFSYRFWGVGPGYQCLYFDVTNTGGLTWQSYTLAVKDITHGDTGTSSENVFINYDNWCTLTETLLDLTPGETGTASVVLHMVHPAAGDDFEATLTLCSGNDHTGFCLTKTISFIF